MSNNVVIVFLFHFEWFPINLPQYGTFFDPLVSSWFMKMHECIRTKAYLTFLSAKTWKSSILGIPFIENVDWAAFAKEERRTKRVCPKLSDLKIWYEVSPYRSKSTDQVSLQKYLPDIKVKRYRTCRADWSSKHFPWNHAVPGLFF